MRWLVEGASPPLSWRPSRVAHAQPPGPGLPEQAPSVQTSRAPSGAGMSARRGLADFAAGLAFAAPLPAAGCWGLPAAQATCAQVSPDLAISSPGWMRDEQTPQVVAYFAVIGTRTL